MKTDLHLFLSRARSLIGLTAPYRSERYKKWLRARDERPVDFHHVLGSVHGMKSTDLMAITLTREEHQRVQNEPLSEYQFLGAVLNLMKYVEYLEGKTKK